MTYIPMSGILNRLGSQEKHTRIYDYLSFWLIMFIVFAISSLYYVNLLVIKYRWDWFWHLGVIEFGHDINGSLLYIPFLAAVILLRFRGIFIIWITAIILIMPYILRITPDVPSLFNNILFMTAPMLIIGYISLQIRWRERERIVIIEREKEKQFYLSRILKAQDDERKHIAQELHDDTTQVLLVVATRVQSMISDKYFEPGSEPYNQLEWVRDTILQLSGDIRRISVELRPGILDSMGFIPAIESLVDSLEQNYNIETKFEVQGSVRELPQDAQISIIRVIQEALNNIRRHSKATEARVKLIYNAEKLLLTIADNGQGFMETDIYNTSQDAKKLGLIGMRERIGAHGGSFDIRSEKGKGTTISISLDY